MRHGRNRPDGQPAGFKRSPNGLSLVRFQACREGGLSTSSVPLGGASDGCSVSCLFGTDDKHDGGSQPPEHLDAGSSLDQYGESQIVEEDNSCDGKGGSQRNCQVAEHAWEHT